MKDFSKIKLLILDNDGVLTDGKIIYNENYIESKNFSAKDGLGIKLLQQTDVELAIITGRTSTILEKRCEDLDIKYLYQKIHNKLVKTTELLKELDLTWENVAYLGDDWNDYPVLKRCAVSATPSDAFDTIKDEVDIVLQRKGGEGAVRELIEIILKEKGIFKKSVKKLTDYLESC